MVVEFWNWRCWFNTSGERWRRWNGRLNDLGYVECFALLYAAFVYKHTNTHTREHIHTQHKTRRLTDIHPKYYCSRERISAFRNQPCKHPMHNSTRAKVQFLLFFATRFLIGADASDARSPVYEISAVATECWCCW